MSRMSIVIVLALAASVLSLNAETVWWTYEYDGTDTSGTNWAGNTGTVQTEGDTTYLHINGPTRYDGYSNNVDWAVAGAYTMELRYRYWGTADGGEDNVNTTESKAQQGMIMCNGVGRSFSDIFETTSEGLNDTIRFGGTSAEGTNWWVDSGTEWNIMRIVYNGSGNGFAYLLAGGEMIGNGGAWDSSTINAIINNWAGFGNSETRIYLNGKMDIDYIRWADGIYNPVAVPEPVTLSLLVLGSGVFVIRRNKK